MRCDVSEHDGYRVIAIKDETIDFTNISDFRDVLDDNAKGCEGHVVLDLSGVSYVGSVGLGLISLLSVMLSKEGRRFVVVCDTEEVKRLFHISGLARVLDVVDSVSSAARHLES